MSRYLFIFPLLLLLLGGCTQERQTPLRIGLPDWLGYQPLLWADTAYLPKGTVEFIEMPSNTESVRLFNNGMIDLACVTVDDALRLLEHNNDLRIIAVMDISHGGDAMVSKPDIGSIDDLKGRRIGFEKEGAGSYMLLRILQKAALKESEVILVPVRYYDHEQALVNDQVDALITFEPLATSLINGGATKLFDSKMIPNEIVDILITRKETIDNRPESLRKILDAWYRSADDIQKKHSVAHNYLESYLEMSNEDLQSSFENLKFLSAKEAKAFILSPEFKEIIGRVQESLVKAGQLSGKKDTTVMLEKEVLEVLY